MSDEQNFPPPPASGQPTPMPTPTSSPMPTPVSAPMPSVAPPTPTPAASLDQFAPPTLGSSTASTPASAPQKSSGGKNGLILGVVAAVVAVAVAAFVVLGGKDDKKDDTTPMSTEEVATDDDASGDDADTPIITLAPADVPSDLMVIGEQADVPGGVARVNSVETDAAPINQYATPEPGFTLTRVEHEMCAIDDSVSFGWTDWAGHLDSGTEAEMSLNNDESPMFTLYPGQCARGYLVFNVPDGSVLVDVVRTDFFSDVQAAWGLTSTPVAIDGPMASTSEKGNPLGSSFTFDNGAEVTVLDAGNYTSTDEYYELPAGRKLVAANVRVCSQAQLITAMASDFYVMTDDNYLGVYEFYNSTFETSDLDVGDCAEGGIVFLIPEESSPTALIYRDFGSGAEARWTP